MQLSEVAYSKLPTIARFVRSRRLALVGGLSLLRDRVEGETSRIRRELAQTEEERDRWRERTAMLERQYDEDGGAPRRRNREDGFRLGQFVRGRICEIFEGNAYIEIDGRERLVHIPECSWGDIRHPAHVLWVGRRVWVKVLSTPSQAMHPYLVLAPECTEQASSERSTALEIS